MNKFSYLVITITAVVTAVTLLAEARYSISWSAMEMIVLCLSPYVALVSLIKRIKAKRIGNVTAFLCVAVCGVGMIPVYELNTGDADVQNAYYFMFTPITQWLVIIVFWALVLVARWVQAYSGHVSKRCEKDLHG